MSSNLKSFVFGKQQSCPSSETLLTYIGGSLSVRSRQSVGSHLASCDFCNAELQLLSKHRLIDERYVLAEMPLEVRVLAEKLLPTNCSVKRAQRAA